VNNDLVLSVYFGLIILFTNADAIVELLDHAASFVVEVVDICILDGNPSSISISDTINHSIKVCGFNTWPFLIRLLLLHHQ